jgi:hypothetical protein
VRGTAARPAVVWAAFVGVHLVMLWLGYKVGLNTTRFLMSLGDLVVGWLLVRQAEVALAKLAGSASAADTAFYEGKVAAARFFTTTVLPELTARRRVVETTDLALMDLAPEAF